MTGTAAGTAPPRGHLIIVCGLPGSGKTTIAGRLAVESTDAVRCCPDEWMDAAGISQWDAVVRARIERAQWDIAQVLLRRGTTVIIEWGSWGRAERDELRDGARAAGSTVELVWLDVPADELRRRLRARDQEDPPPTEADLARWLASFEAPTEEELRSYDRHERRTG